MKTKNMRLNDKQRKKRSMIYFYVHFFSLTCFWIIYACYFVDYTEKRFLFYLFSLSVNDLCTR